MYWWVWMLAGIGALNIILFSIAMAVDCIQAIKNIKLKKDLANSVAKRTALTILNDFDEYFDIFGNHGDGIVPSQSSMQIWANAIADLYQIGP